MGTNYYAHTSPSDTEGLHIGKQSAGWDFLFHSIPEKGLITVAAWRDLLSQDGTRIADEYGQSIQVEEFFAMATQRPVDTAPRLRPHTEVYRGDSMFGDQFHTDMDARGVPFLNAEFF